MKLAIYQNDGTIVAVVTGNYDKSIQNRPFIEIDDDVVLEGKKVNTDTLELVDEVDE